VGNDAPSDSSGAPPSGAASAAILRSGLLAGARIVVAAGAQPGPLATAVAARAATLGASVRTLAVDPFGDEPEPGERADALLWDGQGAFAAADGVDAVRACLDGAWLAVRPVATRAMADGGLVVLLAPGPGDAHREAARSGLENLARTLSIEWARFGVRPVAILPGPGSADAEVAELVAYLASSAGAYYSGCAFALA
jgi:NAD(P)-dependent dehydrogenase (short-subunit alcohol dehydrogenase family)